MRDEAFVSFSLKGFCASALLLAGAACATAPTPAPAPPEPVAAPIEPAAPVYQLGDFLGAEPAAIDALLGAPSLTRREGAGEYRRYGLSTCTLIIILYPDDTGVHRVAHVDATALRSGADKPDLEECLAAG